MQLVPKLVILPWQLAPMPAASLVSLVLVHAWQSPLSLAALMLQQPVWNASAWAILFKRTWSAALLLHTWKLRPHSLLGAPVPLVEPIAPYQSPVHCATLG